MIKWAVVGAIALALVAGAAGGALALWLGHTGGEDDALAMHSTTPGMDYIDAFTCPDGLIREVQVRGVEDNFSRAGDEQAVPRAALMELVSMQQMASGEIPNSPTLRNYDERGVDKFLFDHFAVEPGVVSGELVFSARALNGGRTDSAQLGSRYEEDRADDYFKDIGFSFQPSGVQNSGQSDDGFNGLVIVPLADFSVGSRKEYPTLISYLNSTKRSLEVDLVIEDDTVVDFAALLICRQPENALGTGMTSSITPQPETGLNHLSCGWDQSMPLCQPESGHLRCEVPQRIACYRESKRKPPSIPESASVNYAAYVPGEVKLTEPVRPDKFQSLAQASAFCAGKFGKGFRVLSYHEGGGGSVLTHSRIEPLATGIVHVGDQPYANCWDRPERVIDR